MLELNSIMLNTNYEITFTYNYNKNKNPRDCAARLLTCDNKDTCGAYTHGPIRNSKLA